MVIEKAFVVRRINAIISRMYVSTIIIAIVYLLITLCKTMKI